VAACHRSFDPFLAELRQINNDLAATPKYDAYLTATRKLKSDYVKFDVNKIPSTSCQVAVGGPAAGAYVMHLTASQSWTKCSKRHDCSATLVRLKKRWEKATKLTILASQAFATVTPA
jgi:hypothetical protein